MAPTGFLWCDGAGLITRFQTELAAALTSQRTNENTAACSLTNENNAASSLTNENTAASSLTNEDSTAQGVLTSASSLAGTLSHGDDCDNSLTNGNPDSRSPTNKNELESVCTNGSTGGSSSANVSEGSTGTFSDDFLSGRWKLVRKHDKHLEKGDFSLANLDNAAAWGAAINPSRLDISVLDTHAVKISKLDLRGNVCFVHLDRKATFEAYFTAAEAQTRNNNAAQTRINVQLLKGREDGCEMWRVRSELCAAMLNNLLNHCPSKENTQFIGRSKHVISVF